jgi:hypothetical protein
VRFYINSSAAEADAFGLQAQTLLDSRVAGELDLAA